MEPRNFLILASLVCLVAIIFSATSTHHHTAVSSGAKTTTNPIQPEPDTSFASTSSPTPQDTTNYSYQVGYQAGEEAVAGNDFFAASSPSSLCQTLVDMSKSGSTNDGINWSIVDANQFVNGCVSAYNNSVGGNTAQSSTDTPAASGPSTTGDSSTIYAKTIVPLINETFAADLFDSGPAPLMNIGSVDWWGADDITLLIYPSTDARVANEQSEENLDTDDRDWESCDNLFILQPTFDTNQMRALLSKWCTFSN